VGVQAFLGFSSGLPIALAGSTLQAWLSVSNVALMNIGLVSLLTQPYAYKFLWAPFLDKYIPPFLGKRRGWILITQLVLIFLLVIFSAMNPSSHLDVILGLGFLLALTSASQDIAIDAYRTEILTEHERGIGVSLFMIGYRIGLIASGGFALGLADLWGWKLTYLCMSGLMLVGVLANLIAKEGSPPETSHRSSSFFEPFIALYRQFSFKSWCAILSVLLLYKLGDALVLSLSSTFLLQDLHFSLTAVGLANKSVGILMSILGGFVGGLLLIRLSTIQGLFFFGLLQALSNGGFFLLASHSMGFIGMASVIGMDQFCSGLGSVAFIAFIMGLCESSYSATQYALFSAIASLGRIYVGPFAAWMVEEWGWSAFYLISFLLSFPGVICLFGVRSIPIAIQTAKKPA
jgi:PAT family beta-lactamase induction signal transducer AmpG